MKTATDDKVTVKQVIDLKGPLKGKGGSLAQWRADTEARLAEVYAEMAQLSAESKSIEGRRFGLHAADCTAAALAHDEQHARNLDKDRTAAAVPVTRPGAVVSAGAGSGADSQSSRTGIALRTQDRGTFDFCGCTRAACIPWIGRARYRWRATAGEGLQQFGSEDAA